MDKLPPGVDLSTIPVVPPPPGKHTDLHSYPLGNVSIIIVSLTIAFMMFFLTIRIYTKLSEKGRICFDDWCAVIGAVLAIALAGTLLAAKNYGKHIWNLSIADVTDKRAAKIVFAQEMLTGPANYLGKISLLALYHSIFSHIQAVRYSIYVAAVIGLIILAMTPMDAILCSPPKGAGWGTHNPQCDKSYKYGIAQGLSSLLIDLYILVMPIPIISRLNLERKRKIGIMLIFLTGILAVVADCIVFKYRIDMWQGYDISYAGYVILLCSVVETGLSVACSSMPTIAKFMRLKIWETGHLYTLRSLLRSAARRSSRGSSKTPSNARSSESIGRSSQKARKYDPYSINMPTTHASVTQLTSNEKETGADIIELGDASNSRPKPEISGHGAHSRRFEGQGIQKISSVEQHEDKFAVNVRDIV